MQTASRLLAVALALVLAPPRGAAAPVAEPERPVCLLTGFEPFGGASVNASWEAVKALDGRIVAGHRVAAARLPVVYDAVAGPLRAAVEKHRPAIVISFGVGTKTVRIERVARNGYHRARPPDNRGRRPPRDRILPDGPGTIRTGLPVEAILRSLKAARIGAGTSDDAGGYLCNECFYRLMAMPREGAAAGIRARGFIHVPPFGARDPEGGTFTPDKLRRAVRLAVEAAAEAIRADARRPPERP